MENIVVQVMDCNGGTLTAQKDRLTGYILIESVNGRTGEKDYAEVDPTDEATKAWFKEVFPPVHLEILFGTDN